MQDEIELKLAVNSVDMAPLDDIFKHFNVIEKQRDFLANTYYDNSNQYFSKHKMGLRVRRQHDDYTLTLKTDGKVSGGLHVRPEYNVALRDAQPDLSALIQAHDLQLDCVNESLLPIFSTDFERQTWLVQYTLECQIEAAFDQGAVVADTKQQLISEIEFELKCGSLAAFFAFVMDFLTHFQGETHFYSVSKAKRGYQLAQGKTAGATDWIENWRKFLYAEKRAPKTQEKLTALLSYEQALIEETLALGADFFAANFIKTVERIGAFFNLYHYYEENKQLLENLQNEQTATNEDMRQNATADLIEANKRFFAQIFEIIRLHSETKDNVSAMTKLFALIQAPSYAQRMLSLIILTSI